MACFCGACRNTFTERMDHQDVIALWKHQQVVQWLRACPREAPHLPWAKKVCAVRMARTQNLSLHTWLVTTSLCAYNRLGQGLWASRPARWPPQRGHVTPPASTTRRGAARQHKVPARRRVSTWWPGRSWGVGGRKAGPCRACGAQITKRIVRPARRALATGGQTEHASKHAGV